MKKIVPAFLAGVSLIGLVTALVTLPACTSLTTVTANTNGTFTTNITSVLDTNRVDAVANQAMIDVAADLLPGHPELVPQLQTAANELNALATSPTITLSSVLGIVETLPISQLKSQTAKLSFQGATLLIALVNLPPLPAQATADLQSIAKALANGINTGIEQAALSAPPAAPPPATTATK